MEKGSAAKVVLWFGLASTLVVGAACSSDIAGAPPRAAIAHDAGVPEGVEAPVTPRPIVDDTGTLQIDVRITAYDVPPRGPEDAEVALMVSVVERATGQPVTDAVVSVGRVGQAATLLPYDVYSLSTYGGPSRGYATRWEISIERGDDHVRGLVLEGPSYSSVEIALDRSPGVITWSPAREDAVTSEVCATTVGSARPAHRCVAGDDEGELSLGAGEAASMFPFDATWWIAVVRTRTRDLGPLGAARVETTVGEQRDAGP